MSVARQNVLRCTALRKDGSACRAFAIRDGLCIGHQPNGHEARSKGGAATSNAERAAKAFPSLLRQVRGSLLNTMARVAVGEYTPAQGSSIAAIANAIVHVHQAHEYEMRLRQLENRATDEGLFQDRKGRERGPVRWQTTMDD
jgi:hypothetical protein